MSKYFDQAWKKGAPSKGNIPSGKMDIGQLLRGLKNPGAAVGSPAEDLLLRCGKNRFKQTTGRTIISQPDEAAALGREFYQAIRTRLMSLLSAKGMRSVVLTSPFQGEGKTLTTVNLGLCCAQLRDCRVLLIDADLRTRGLSEILDKPAVPGLRDFLAGSAKWEDVIFATESPSLYVVGAGRDNGQGNETPPAELFADPRWKEFVGRCSELFNLVLVDSLPVVPLADFELTAAACDGVLVVVRAFRTPRELLRKAMTRLDTEKVLGIVLNAADSRGLNGSGYYKYYQAGYGKK